MIIFINYILGNGTFLFQDYKIFFIFIETSSIIFFLYFRRNFPRLKNKKAPSSKNFYISGGNLQSLKKQTKKSALKKVLDSYIFTIFTAIKHREIPHEAKIQHGDVT